MKRISRRMLFLLGLMALLVLGLGIFAVQYGIHAGNWVTFSGSPHVYAGSNLSTGRVVDRGGTLLLDSTDGRAYSDDAALRQSVMHLLGDRFGYIAAPVLNEYADEMVGFDPVNGLYTAAENGNTAHLTISASVQKTAQAALAGRKGTVGVYNYKTGEILCAVTAPAYDPDNMPEIEGDTTGRYDGVYLNRFFQNTYVPGSIFKVMTALAALETIDGVEEQTFHCDGSCVIGADTIVCNGTHGDLDLQLALEVSCNVAFAQLALQVGEDTLETYAQRFGITDSLVFDGLATAKGHFDLDGAADSQIAWAGIGQYTDLINACQYMTFMGAVASGGKAAQPYLMEKVDGGLLTGYKAKTKILDRSMDETAANTLAEMMHGAVENRYGAWQFPDLYVCAKSGTAEVGEGTTPHATFAGFIRDEDYPLAFVVIVEHGGSGSAACAPIAGQVLNACVEVLKAE